MSRPGAHLFKLIPQTVLWYALLTASLTLGQIIGPSNQPEAYFNGSTYIRLQTTVSLKKQTGLSFRTCQGGELFSQTHKDNVIELSVDQTTGWLKFSGKTLGKQITETVKENFLDNKWHNVHIFYVLGNLTLSIDNQYRLLANGTFHSELLTSQGLYNDGAVLIIGKHYDGCIMEGPSIVFNKTIIQSHEVRFGPCPINDDCGIHETKAACLLAPCMDHGACIEVNNSYKCICNPGYVGTNCERVIKPCETHSCLNGGTCVDHEDKINFHCECPPKFTGKHCENPITVEQPCSSNPCKNGGTCQYDGTPHCICLDGFSGNDCSVNLDDCQQNPCKNNGVCNDGIGSFTCNCTNTGYQGQFCEKNINECLEAPCLNGGKCFDNYGGYFCQCTSGFYGQNCDMRISECDSTPCFNQGVCKDQENGYFCVCPPGFTGLQCETSLRQAQLQCGCESFGICIDDNRCICKPEYTGEYPNCKPTCLVNACKNGGTCRTTSTTINCSCPPNFEGERCERKIPDCTTLSCLNGGKCIPTASGYVCDCPEFFTGRLCEQQYVYCENNNCKNNGTCKMYSSSRTSFCDCQLGFKGKFCDEIDEDCTEGNCFTERNDSCHCQENAKCVINEYTGVYSCECLHGYTGPNCVDIDECKTEQPCQQGICKNIPGGFECYCKPGYSGEKCNLDINECLSSPCKNGASCLDKVNSYDCVCLPGYAGKNCEIDINECDSNPCMYNSKCTDLVNGFKCQCEEGRTGTRCEIDIDDCQPQPCANDGICIDRLNGYVCNCTDTGYEGEHCDMNIDDCDSNPCVNEGFCLDSVKDYSCQCEDGYTGKNCETDINECASQPCQHGGECIERSNQTLYETSDPRLPAMYREVFYYGTAAGFDCLCVHGTSGPRCEIDENECLPNPCVYGKCIDQIGSYRCECNPGFEGPQCNIDINECEKYQPCVHGTCRDGHATYYCDCSVGYGGKNCSVELIGCKNEPCNNKGTCHPYVINEVDHHFNCSCQNGFYGHTCETTTTMSLSGNTLITVNTTRDEGYDISFRFKTTLGDGLLAVGSGLTYYILELSKGRLNLHSSLLNKWEGVFIGSGLNNSNWQRVFVAINTTHIILSANDEQTIYPITYNDNNNASSTSFPTTFVGGSTSDKKSLTHKPPLVGCVEDIIVNTVWVLPTSQNSNISLRDADVGCHREPQCKPNPCHSGGQCTDNWRNFSCTCERPHLGHICQYNYTAATFCHENITNSLVTVKVDKDAKRAVRSIVDISMFIRTRESNGQIFYLGSEKRDQSETYIAAELENGELLVRIEIHGNAESYIVGGVKLDNGYNHLIEVIRNVTLVQVKLNGTEYFRKTISATGHLDAEILYLGGQQPNLRTTRQANDPLNLIKSEILQSTGPAAITTHNEIHFKGIIQDVQISNGSKIMVVEFFPLQVQDLHIPMSFGNVTFDENLVLPGVLSDNKCRLNPCGDGNCFNTWNDYQCNCSRGFKGKDCKEREFCKLEQCPELTECKNLDEGLECITNITFDGDTPPLKYEYSLTNISWIETIELSFRSRSWGTILYAHYGMNHFLIFMNYDEILIECMMLGRQAHNKFKKDHFEGQWITLLFTIHDLTLKGGFKESVTDDTPNFTFGDFDAGNFTEIFVKGELYIGGTGDIKIFDYTNLIQNNNNNTALNDELDDNKLDSNNGGFRIIKNKENDYFKGCLGEIRINNYLLPFFPDSNLPNITVKNFDLTSNLEPSVGCKLCFDKDCNRGTCANPDTDYKCDCPVGFTADDCSIDINECEDNQCRNNATCNDEIGKYSCICLNGYDGEYCQNEINECESSPCLNGGSCEDLIGNYSCSCTDEFTGVNCERQKVITCSDHPCANGATCINENKNGNNFTCACPKGIVGDRCETSYCEAKPCENKGICNVVVIPPRCDCDLGFDGLYCEQNIDECASDPCLNNGKCEDLINGYRCNCEETGFVGLNCEEDVNECDRPRNPCGQGKCTNTIGSYRCTCENKKCGLNCNLDDPCLENPCLHGSCEPMCTNSTDYLCKCPPEFTGKNCSDVQAFKAEQDTGVNILFIVIPVVVVIVVGLAIGLVVLVNIARSKRATRGTYSPSAQEFCNPRVELDHVLKPPPEERLI